MLCHTVWKVFSSPSFSVVYKGSHGQLCASIFAWTWCHACSCKVVTHIRYTTRVVHACRITPWSRCCYLIYGATVDETMENWSSLAPCSESPCYFCADFLCHAVKHWCKPPTRIFFFEKWFGQTWLAGLLLPACPTFIVGEYGLIGARKKVLIPLKLL